MSERIFLPNSTECFVCGEDNAAGLQGRFYVEDGLVKLPLSVQPHHGGYPNVIHGGIVAAALDETMGWAAARAMGRMCMTAEMTIRYIKPATMDKALTVCGEVEKHSRRVSKAIGYIIDDEGEIYVRGKAKFVPLSVEDTLMVDDMLLYRGGEERVFDTLRDDS